MNLLKTRIGMSFTMLLLIAMVVGVARGMRQFQTDDQRECSALLRGPAYRLYMHWILSNALDDVSEEIGELTLSQITTHNDPQNGDIQTEQAESAKSQGNRAGVSGS